MNSNIFRTTTRTVTLFYIGLLTVASPASAEEADVAIVGPKDLALTYRSDVDGSTQPYRLYLPPTYDGKRRVPLFVALHGTGGNQDKYFDHPTYQNGIYKREANKRGIAVVCPHGRGTTEYRGIGENDVLTVIDQVCRRFLIDRDRIVCSGQSMGGTGTTYLCSRYPDLFAGGAPLASTYGHLALVDNLRHVPMFYVHGAEDWPVYAATGPIPITRRARELGYDHVSLWMIPDVGHNTMAVSTERVLDWALQQRRVKNPQRVTHRAYLPIHGRAWWVEISGIETLGLTADLDAEIASENTIRASVRNTRQFILRPDPELLDLTKAIQVSVNGTDAFVGRCKPSQQIRFDREEGQWRGRSEQRKVHPYKAYGTHRIGKVIQAPSAENLNGTTTLGNWITDAMREATGADIAIATHRHYRGVPLRDGQDVHLMNLLNWLRPFNQALVKFQMTGKDLLEILEDNIRGTDKRSIQFIVQVSGCRYAFDHSRPQGQRIIKTDIHPDRQYTIVCYGSLLTRGDVLYLGERYEKIPYELLELTNIAVAWRAIDKVDGQLTANLEQRVRDATPE